MLDHLYSPILSNYEQAEAECQGHGMAPFFFFFQDTETTCLMNVFSSIIICNLVSYKVVFGGGIHTAVINTGSLFISLSKSWSN